MSATGFVDGPKSLFIILLCGLILLPLSVFAQGGLLDELEEETPCTAELVSEVKAYQPGVPFRLGVWIKPLPGWHGYWHSPRDGGDPPEVHWDLPSGWKISGPSFPAPERMVESGELITYGYSKSFMLLFDVTPPETPSTNSANDDATDDADAESPEPIWLKAKVTWQVCKTTCIYGESKVSLGLKSAQKPKVDPGAYSRLRGWAKSIPLKEVPKGFHVEQEWIPSEEKGSIAGRWTIRWARKWIDRRPAIPVRWQVYPHALVAGLLDEVTPEPWIPDPQIHKRLSEGNQVTFVVRDVGQGFHPGLLGATMVPSPGKAIGPVSGYPAFECRGK